MGQQNVFIAQRLKANLKKVEQAKCMEYSKRRMLETIAGIKKKKLGFRFA